MTILATRLALLIKNKYKVRSIESVPFSRYFHLCNVLRIHNVRAIPTYSDLIDLHDLVLASRNRRLHTELGGAKKPPYGVLLSSAFRQGTNSTPSKVLLPLLILIRSTSGRIYSTAVKSYIYDEVFQYLKDVARDVYL